MDPRQPHLPRSVAREPYPALAVLEYRVRSRDHLQCLRLRNLTRGNVALPLRVPIGWTPPKSLSRVPEPAAYGPMLCLRCDGEAARTMKLTPRCTELFRLLRGARWLSTGQIHRRFFKSASLDAARKRLRKLVEARHLVAYREHQMKEVLFTLGPEGKRVLEEVSTEEIRLERKPPKQLAHFAGINDIRIAAELAGSLSYFFACWELPALNWQHPVIPDAICAFSHRTFAFEYDRGMEGVRFFADTKIVFYEHGLEGLPLTAVVVITDGRQRIKNLTRVVSCTRQTILFSTLEKVRTQGLLAPIFNQNGEYAPVRLF
jgi:hypothetical protein